jgi:hypothetical protein
MIFTGMMIGWGIFWLLIWGSVFLLYIRSRDDKEFTIQGVGIIGSVVSIFWIAAWVVVRLLG